VIGNLEKFCNFFLKLNWALVKLIAKQIIEVALELTRRERLQNKPIISSFRLGAGLDAKNFAK
jgi:hypothetical protein